MEAAKQSGLSEDEDFTMANFTYANSAVVSRMFEHLKNTMFLGITVSDQTMIINPRRACAARVTVLALCVCVSVCLLPATNCICGIIIGFSWISTRGFSKKPSVQKLWLEKANMQML